MAVYEQWQYYVPGHGAGLLQPSIALAADGRNRHLRYLLRLRFNVKRLPRGTYIFPYHSTGGALLRERAISEGLPIDDRLRESDG